MTWLPLAGDGSGPELAAVLALQPEAAATWLGVVDRSWWITDPFVLDRCRLRIAQVLECRAVLSAADPARLAGLTRSPNTVDDVPPWSDLDRAALSYSEQFAIDQSGISGSQVAELARVLDRPQMCNLVAAINAHDGHQRVLSVLDIPGQVVELLFKLATYTVNKSITAMGYDRAISADRLTLFHYDAHGAQILELPGGAV